MRVIRTLSVNDSVEEREEEKTKLEQQFRESDQKLDNLVLTFIASDNKKLFDQFI